MEHLPDLYSSLFSLTFIFSNHKYWLVLFQIVSDSRLLTVSIFVYIRLNSNIFVSFRIIKHYQSNSQLFSKHRRFFLLRFSLIFEFLTIFLLISAFSHKFLRKFSAKNVQNLVWDIEFRPCKVHVNFTVSLSL